MNLPAGEGRLDREVRHRLVPTTPGPWKAMGSKMDNDFGILDSTGLNVIGECFSDIRHQGENALQEAGANAKLMAAAPDLLAAVERLLRAHYSDGVTYSGDHPAAIARRAVEKAELAMPNFEANRPKTAPGNL